MRNRSSCAIERGRRFRPCPSAQDHRQCLVVVLLIVVPLIVIPEDADLDLLGYCPRAQREPPIASLSGALERADLGIRHAPRRP